MPSSATFADRIAAIRERVDIVDVIGRVVPLVGRGDKPRGKCPFHGSKSDSLAVDRGRQRAICWGCQWSGDAIGFVKDFFSLEFGEALAKLESEHGLDGLAAAPVARVKRTPARPERPMVSSAAFGRHLWDRGAREYGPIWTYFNARGVPGTMLGEARLRDIRFVGLGPIAAWAEDGSPDDVPQAPAMVALVRAIETWRPIGVHVTFLTPDFADKMARQRWDGSAYPARKLLGAAGGGCVVLGAYADAAPLFVGEGLETLLSGMALAGAGDGAVGLAALSLDNLQGRPKLIRGALPLYDPETETAGLARAHAGPVTVLVDADMAPLPGPIDRATGRAGGVKVIERRGAPVARRTVTPAERAALCGTLAVKSWRAAGARAQAVRPRMGLDFNDAALVAGGGR